MTKGIRIHQYSGKESGIMVIGSAKDLNLLANEIIQSTQDKSDFIEANWPPMVASRNVEKNRDNTLSFHIETIKGNIPKNKPASEIVKITFFIFAIIGLISTVKWVVHVVL